MANLDILNGKKVIAVDDELDIVETIEEMLEMCDIKTATAYESAKQLLETETFDVAFFDIMGVKGYELLSIATEKGITSVMLTAHAISSENFNKAMDGGACAYLPKDSLHQIDVYLAEIFEQGKEAQGINGNWFGRLKGYFENQFGSNWLD
jgi:DNA-binding NtrC family response regulator